MSGAYGAGDYGTGLYSLAYVYLSGASAVDVEALGTLNGSFGFGGHSSVPVSSVGDLRVGVSFEGLGTPTSVSGQADPLTLERNSWQPVSPPLAGWQPVVVPSIVWQPVLPQ